MLFSCKLSDVYNYSIISCKKKAVNLPLNPLYVNKIKLS